MRDILGINKIRVCVGGGGLVKRKGEEKKFFISIKLDHFKT